MRKPQLLDVIRLTSPVPEHGLSGGEIGTIVEEFDAPDEAYEVEFADDYGETIAMFSLTPAQFEVVVPWELTAPQPSLT
jgi:hypothetical protein